MKFLIALLLSIALFFVLFAATATGLIAAISFVTWELPTVEFLTNIVPTVVRVILVFSILFGLGFVFSKEGRAEWQL